MKSICGISNNLSLYFVPLARAKELDRETSSVLFFGGLLLTTVIPSRASICAKVDGKLSSNIMCLLPLFTNNNPPPFFKKAHFCSSSIVAFIEAAARRLPSTSTTSTLSFEAATASIYYTSSRHETTSKRVLL